LDLVYEPFGVWRVRGWQRGEVTVRYAMTLQHDRFPNKPGDDELAYARPYGVMWTGRALFVEGAPSNDVIVAFTGPEGWRVTSPWRDTDASGLRFQPDDTDDLLNSAFFAGVHAETIVRFAGMEARIAAGPDMAAEAAYYRQMLETYLPAFADFFGAADDTFARRNHGARRVLERRCDGTLHQHRAGRRSERTGWRDHARRHAPRGGPRRLSSVARPMAHQPGRPPRALLAHGRDRRILLGADQRAPRRVRRGRPLEIARHHAAYLNALPGGSIAAAGRTKLDNRSSQDRVYSGGFTAALALDFMIRRETGGAKSLDDVMRRIHARFGQSGAQVLTPARLIQTIRDATGVSAERFFASHVDGVDPIALSDHLLEAGVCLETRRGDQGWSATAVRCDAVTPDQETTWRAWVGGLDLSVPRLRPPEPAQPERPRNAPQRP
jgi:hypothetical protein